MDIVRRIPHVTHVESFATKPGILKTDDDFQGIVLKGVDENYDWSFFRDNLKEGDVFTVSGDSTTSRVIISRYLANLMRLKTDDGFLAYFVNKEQVRARRFVISGIYDTGFGDYDKLFVIADIKHIRRLNNWKAEQSGGLEIKVDAFENMDAVSDSVYYAVGGLADSKGNMFFVRSIKDMNPMIFSWLDVLDTNVVVILVLMLAVAGFTMIAGLLIIILERVRMISVLKALGATNGLIRRVFLYVACALVGKGMLWGDVIGIVLCLLQWKFKLFGLDASVYYLDAVPINLNVGALILLNVGTLAASMLILLAPSHIITTIRPSAGIRFE
jgi:lipoprotein-releasing system permease protein